MAPPLLLTKLHPPALPPKRVRRARLDALLDEGLALGRALTLVSAPAGFGKSTCIAAWAAGLERPLAWLSLDPADDDPARFYAYLAAALGGPAPEMAHALKPLFADGQVPPPGAAAAVLANELARLTNPFVLVLDDFQEIQERAILAVFELLLANPPGQMHLVLITREDPSLPLARLRANNQMTEVRASDLRFNGGEAADFFANTMGMALQTGDLRALESRIEGWIAGLQLAGLSMRGRSDPGVFIASLRGTQRHILSYLTEEVLDRVGPEQRHFLLQTSILNRLSGDLCDAVTGRSDSAEELEHLLAANLFLIPLEEAGGGSEAAWYRYHHLFADLLRSQQRRLSEDELSGLHRRAAAWFDQAGMPAEAIEHALAGQHYPHAVDLLDQHALGIMLQGSARTLERWIDALPPEWQRKSPRASLGFAGMYLMRGNYAGVARHLALAEPAVLADDEPDRYSAEKEALRAEWFAVQANLLNVQGQAEESLAAAGQALRHARPGQFAALSMAYMGLGGAYRLTGDYPALVDAYQKAITNSRAAGSLLAEMFSASALVLTAIQHGQLRFAHQVGQQSVGRYLGEAGEPAPPVAAAVIGALGLVEYEWGHQEKAVALIAQASKLSEMGGHNAGLIFTRVIESRLALSEGDLARARELVQEAADLLPSGAPAWLKPEVLAQQVRVYLAQDDPVSAEAALRQYPRTLDDPPYRPDEPFFLAGLRLYLHQERAGGRAGLHGEADRLAGRLIETAARGGRVSVQMQALLLRAQVEAALGDLRAAGASLAEALALAKPENYVRIFTDEGPALRELLRGLSPGRELAAYRDRLLAAFPGEAEPAPDQGGLVEPLSARELEVLALTAEGLTNSQIADRLVVSLATVKTHLIHVYGKLAARNRADAVMKAKELGLL